jgi:hypothetical protein
MYHVEFFCPPREGYYTYLPYFLRDEGIEIKHVAIWKRDKLLPHSVEMAAFIEDADAAYLFLKYPDIKEQFQRF